MKNSNRGLREYSIDWLREGTETAEGCGGVGLRLEDVGVRVVIGRTGVNTVNVSTCLKDGNEVVGI